MTQPLKLGSRSHADRGGRSSSQCSEGHDAGLRSFQSNEVHEKKEMGRPSKSCCWSRFVEGDHKGYPDSVKVNLDLQ